MANLNVSVNCVYDDSRQLIDLYAGDVDDAWKMAVKACYKAHDTRSAPKSDVVLVNSYPQADQDIDWWGAQASLKEGGTVVGVHHFMMGRALLHYRSEQMGAPWTRESGYPKRKWPVEKAGNAIVYTDRPSRHQILSYDGRVEWLTDWSTILGRLIELHRADATASIYPCGKLQFDSRKHPLEI
jgi:hypothetical protein